MNNGDVMKRIWVSEGRRRGDSGGLTKRALSMRCLRKPLYYRSISVGQQAVHEETAALTV